VRDLLVRVLLIESDRALNRTLKRGLEERGFTVDVACDGGEGEGRARNGDHDVFVLNLMLPDEGGLSLLRELRHDGERAPVFVLTPSGEVEDEVRGLGLGADQYLTIPFEPDELYARLGALVMRVRQAKQRVLRAHDLEIDTASRLVRRQGRRIHLTDREYALLEYMAQRRGRVVTRSMIWKDLYEGNDANTSNLIDVYIGYLRRKIDRGFEMPLILTRWGKGYLLRGDEAGA
jgi:DNA-binding response OmpR family regulator